MKTYTPEDFRKDDAGKPRITLIPPEALLGIASALTYGASKYGADNWQKGTDWRRYADALARHLIAWLMGENLDPESKLPHLHHAGACIVILIGLVERGLGRDDRDRIERLEAWRPTKVEERKQCLECKAWYIDPPGTGGTICAACSARWRMDGGKL